MRIDIATIFPGMFTGPFSESIVKRAVDKGAVEINVVDLRDYAEGKHRQVDDYPYGGGRGMVMKPEPIFAAVEDLRSSESDATCVILLTPQGQVFNQAKANELAGRKHLIMLCGHYEGVDERVRQHLVDLELSIGDYVLTGGELPAMVVTDTVARLVPGVLEPEVVEDESFSKAQLEYPHYTRPANFRGLEVPEILLSGDHQRIHKWRQSKALERTAERRPDLLNGET